MNDNSLAALRSLSIDSSNGNAEALSEFACKYFDGADPQELQARGAASLMAMALTHLRLLDQAGSALGARVRVFNPTIAEDGFASEHTLVQIVHDDMPFLVDSVTMAVNRAGLTVHWMVHPLLVIDRDAKGRLMHTELAGSSSSAGVRVQSLIQLECDRVVAAIDQEALQIDLLRVLGDVGAAVADWPAMLGRLHHLMTQASKVMGTVAQIREGVAFLHWLEDQNFTFLGARDYDLHREGQVTQLIALPQSGLGILRGEAVTPVSQLPLGAQAILDSDHLVYATKAMTRATVHRPAWLDYIAVKRLDEVGRVVGESRFLGLYTSRAYAAPVAHIPVIRDRVAHVLAAVGVVAESHSAKSLQAILEAYPRDELFQVDADTLTQHCLSILRLQERQRTRVLLRRDPFGRFSSALVYVPRDRYNTELRLRMGEELVRSLDGQSVEFTPMLTDHPMARVHYLVRARAEAPSDVDELALEARMASLARRWEDDCQQALMQMHGEALGQALSKRFTNAFPANYRADFGGAVAADDALMLSRLMAQGGVVVKLYRPVAASADEVRFKIYSTTKVALSDALPILERMGVRVLDEQPYRVAPASPADGAWVHDLGLSWPGTVSFSEAKSRFEPLFIRAWCHEIDSDDLNGLVLVTALDARGISVLRAYTRYFKQLGFPFSQSYMEATLCKNPVLTQALMDLFNARFHPALSGDREEMQARLAGQIEAQLVAVASLEEDRVIRQYFKSILATVRTNAWQTDATGAFKPYLSFKFNPRQIPGVPEPRPLHEIWVYSPRFEALHLRNGKVARGGLRWSDRREDFRTEILGLVKAQHVKNTVIVPVGSKGGFVLKAAPSPTDRDAYLAEGIACYKLFLSGMLDLTDNLVKGELVPPPQLVRHDADDPYLVVAADKGTASFSDIANGVSADYGFWLGDAFASGGSVGYDHKKMGITARGAWESTKRHFRALGVDTQTEPFTVVGIGDMSGDVFGNGMLLSPHIRLVAAFDHRHIFLDPDPDAMRSFAERQRLFVLPRSSWDDYDKSLISLGGGVYPRGAKSVQLSAAIQAVLGVQATEMPPAELLNTILKAPVDLIYNGGIGTYVKSSLESHAQVGDKAGDAYRVDGCDLRCKVLVEGGNLGCTQLGRIEYAQRGGLIYTDAIDNSAGVDCSDHEVNIKILLDRVVEAGDLTRKQRNELLASMTEEVGHLVLADNYYQTLAIDIACHQPRYFLDGQQGLMQWLGGAGRLDRGIEFLPSDEEIARRRATKAGLTAPENAVLLAYAKIAVFDDLLASDLPDDPYFSATLKAYFPQALTERYAAPIALHPLKREIIATYVTNTVVNRMGASFINFLAAETATRTTDVVRAVTLAREIFDLDALWSRMDALDGMVPSTLQLDLLARLMSVAKRASRRMLNMRSRTVDLPTLIARYQPAARDLHLKLSEWLPVYSQDLCRQMTQTWTMAGVADDLAHSLATLEFVFPVLDLVDLSSQLEMALERVAQVYFEVENRLELSSWRGQIDRLPTETLWQRQARSSARDDVYAIASQVTQTVLAGYTDIEAWAAQNNTQIQRLAHLLQTVKAQRADLAPISVALREFRQLA